MTPATTTDAPAGPVETVHVVAKTHLDCGFTDLAEQVVDRYVTDFFPRAIALAEELRRDADGDDDAPRLVWTTGSWIVHTALERSRGGSRRALEAALSRGDLAWHALPLTTHTELADPEVVRWGLTLSARLDDRFGRCTTAAKLTDVPGHTIGIVPLLAEAGVRLLHVGVNPASSAPIVPGVFRWRDDPSGAEVVVMYQPGGYGGARAVPGHPHLLAFAHTDDNGGPQSSAAVRDTWASLRGAHPGAVVRAATLSEYAATLTGEVIAALPVLTEEIGDTWIHGVGSDPTKVARLRALQRAHRTWRRAAGVGTGPEGPRWLDAVAEALLLVCEHTWGLDEKTWFPDTVHYAPDALASILDRPATRMFAASWAEQRAYLDVADAAIPASHRDDLDPGPIRFPTSSGPSSFGRQRGAETRTPAAVTLGRWELTIDPVTGAVVRLTGSDAPTLASCDLGRFWFESFDEADYRRWFDCYNVEPGRSEGWAELDFTKPGIDAAGARHGRWDAVSASVVRESDDVVWVVLRPPETAVDGLGCPRDPWVRWRAVDDDQLECTVGWSSKPASRLPEATWCTFRPDSTGRHIDHWEVHKLGRWLDPRAVVSQGNRSLHAVQDGARAFASSGTPGARRLFSIEPLDTALVAPGDPALLRFDDTLPVPAAGVHALIHDNVWGTNFPMWWGGPFACRFLIAIG